MTGENDHPLRNKLLAALAQPALTDEDVVRILGKVQDRIARDAEDERARADLKQHIEDRLNKARSNEAEADCSAWQREDG